MDCNGGDQRQAFATNFDPEINIREITQPVDIEEGNWREIPMSVHQPIFYPNIGERESYLLYHEELESLVKHFPTLRRARFWMTPRIPNPSQSVGECRHDFDTNRPPRTGHRAVRIPKNITLSRLRSRNYDETNWMLHFRFKDGQGIITSGTIVNIKDAYRDTLGQGVSYTTGKMATLGASLMAEGIGCKLVYGIATTWPNLQSVLWGNLVFHGEEVLVQTLFWGNAYFPWLRCLTIVHFTYSTRIKS